MRHAPSLSNLTWSDLAFEVPTHPSRLVLRHNKHLQHGYTLMEALKKMEAHCKAHKQGNTRITGAIKVVEHTKLNGAPLWVKLVQWLRRVEQ